jgi:hypothetical protein
MRTQIEQGKVGNSSYILELESISVPRIMTNNNITSGLLCQLFETFKTAK